MKKNLIGRKSQAYETIWIFNLWQNHTNLINFDSKHFLSQSFQGHSLNPGVTSFVHPFSFILFSLQKILFEFPQSKGDKLCTKIKKKKKNEGHHAHLELKTIMPQSLGSPWIDKQSFPYYMIFMCNTGCALQNWGITLIWHLRD